MTIGCDRAAKHVAMELLAGGPPRSSSASKRYGVTQQNVLLIGDIPGFTPQIGRPVAMLKSSIGRRRSMPAICTQRRGAMGCRDQSWQEGQS